MAEDCAGEKKRKRVNFFGATFGGGFVGAVFWGGFWVALWGLWGAVLGAAAKGKNKNSEVFMEDNPEKDEEKIERKSVKNCAGNVGDALLKVALGCSVAEVTEEYAEVDGKLKLLKRKKTKKDIPPDLKAVQLILEKRENCGEISAMSDEELEKEKQRLLSLLQGEGVKGGKGKTGKATKVSTR